MLLMLDGWLDGWLDGCQAADEGELGSCSLVTCQGAVTTTSVSWRVTPGHQVSAVTGCHSVGVGQWHSGTVAHQATGRMSTR